MTRRRLIQGATATAALGSLPVLAQGQARPPNILFILADDLGYADLGCYGARDIKTPVLDQLAADGLLMTDGYSNSPVCTPTRVALITGRYQYRLPVGIREPIIGYDTQIGLPPAQATLPMLLKALDYRTALVGKWHMGWPVEFGPLKSGYDHYFGTPAGADYFTHQFPRSTATATAAAEMMEVLHEGDTVIERSGYLTDLLADRAITEIHASQKAAQRFFISLHFTAPHSPWQGPGDSAAATSGKLHQDGGTLEKYGEMVSALDSAIGRVLKALDKSGARDDTIVVFTSDNGGERFSDNWPFTGGKRKLLEGGIRVPLIVRWPRRIKPGSRSPQVMASMDWLPTLVEAAGGAPDASSPTDGLSLLNVITGVSPPVSRKLYWRFNRDNQAAVRDGDWKYLRRREREYLFDVRIDPRERADLKLRQPEIFERLRQDFAAWNATMRPYPFPGGRGGTILLPDD